MLLTIEMATADVITVSYSYGILKMTEEEYA
jgi:hypothetical protein